MSDSCHTSVTHFLKSDCTPYTPFEWRSRTRRLTNYLNFNFPPVEIPVAAASGAQKCAVGPLLSARHELPAPIHSVPSDIRCVIFLALCVSHAPNNRRRRTAGPSIRSSCPSCDALLHALFVTLILLLLLLLSLSRQKLLSSTINKLGCFENLKKKAALTTLILTLASFFILASGMISNYHSFH